MLKSCCLLLALALSSFAAHEKRETAPSGFRSVGLAPPDQVVTLRVALTQSDFSGLEEDLYAVSTPRNARYGKHLSKSEVEQRVAPSKDSSSAFDAWISSYGLKSTPLTPAGDWQAVDMTIRQANQLLNANFSMFGHLDLNMTVMRTLSYSLPDSLLSHVSLIHPTVVFPVVGKQPAPISLKDSMDTGNTNSSAMHKRDIPSSCAEAQYSLQCVLDLYGIPTDPANQSLNHLWVSSFGNRFAIKRDLASFLTKYRPDMSNTTAFDLVTINGGLNPQLPIGASLEGDSSTQYTVGVATNVTITYMSVGTGNPDDPFTDVLDQANYLTSLDTLPQALVISSPFFESQISQPLATQLCNAYAQLGARGVSIVHSVGTGGVTGADPFGNCSSGFDVSFPASCPYVTSVGVTGFNAEGQGPEISNYYTSGGFSNLFPRPPYQDSVVPLYIDSLGSTYAGLYNTSGRGIPDVSAYGQGTIIYEGSPLSFGATSFGADIFISIIALLNDLLIAKGKSPLGFLNPWIYANKGMFTDITGGNNPGCNTDGFNSTAGWDPVSGMGSPLFAAMKKAAGL